MNLRSSFALCVLGALALGCSRPATADPLFDTDDTNSASDLFAPPDVSADTTVATSANVSTPADPDQPMIPGLPNYTPDVPGTPTENRKTRVSSLFYDIFGGAAGLGLLVGLTTSGGSSPSHQPGPPPVPEFSSLTGLALLGAPGIFMLARARRCRVAKFF